jgi:hypothetical protein
MPCATRPEVTPGHSIGERLHGEKWKGQTLLSRGNTDDRARKVRGPTSSFLANREASLREESPFHFLGSPLLFIIMSYQHHHLHLIAPEYSTAQGLSSPLLLLPASSLVLAEEVMILQRQLQLSQLLHESLLLQQSSELSRRALLISPSQLLTTLKLCPDILTEGTDACSLPSAMLRSKPTPLCRSRCTRVQPCVTSQKSHPPSRILHLASLLSPNSSS